MQVDYINSVLFAFHAALLIVKVYILYHLYNGFKVSKSTVKQSYLLVYDPLQIFIFIFSFFIVLSELHFIYSFYEDIDLYYYEYLAISDEIFFSLIALKLLKRGEDG